jgi:hypothetical protein
MSGQCPVCSKSEPAQLPLDGLIGKWKKRCAVNGGRTRTRTWDPLIKSPIFNLDRARLFSQLQGKAHMSDQKVTLKFPTLERLGLDRIRGRFPELRRRGFSAAIRAIDPDIGRVHIIPDGWFVQSYEANPKCIVDRVFTCVEIEDRHPLTADKLWRYCGLWDILDSFDCFLRLYVFDRYGFNRRELDLGQLYFQGLVAMHGPTPSAHWQH